MLRVEFRLSEGVGVGGWEGQKGLEENTTHKRHVPSTTRGKEGVGGSLEMPNALGALVRCTRPHSHFKREGGHPTAQDRK
jgi:hypothetical protein